MVISVSPETLQKSEVNFNIDINWFMIFFIHYFISISHFICCKLNMHFSIISEASVAMHAGTQPKCSLFWSIISLQISYCLTGIKTHTSVSFSQNNNWWKITLRVWIIQNDKTGAQSLFSRLTESNVHHDVYCVTQSRKLENNKLN